MDFGWNFGVRFGGAFKLSEFCMNKNVSWNLNISIPLILSSRPLDSTTDGIAVSPVELEALRLDVPLFTPVNELHLMPNQAIKSAVRAFRMNTNAKLSWTSTIKIQTPESLGQTCILKKLPPLN